MVASFLFLYVAYIFVCFALSMTVSGPILLYIAFIFVVKLYFAFSMTVAGLLFHEDTAPLSRFMVNYVLAVVALSFKL